MYNAKVRRIPGDTPQPASWRHLAAALVLIGLVAGCGSTADSESAIDPATGDEPMVDPIPASEIPPAPVLSPTEALADMQVEDGFAVELVAAEPDVVAPVAMTFDADGAIWVVEMRGYMQRVDGSGEDEPVGRIRVLRDLDGDWQYETVSTFLDGLVMPRAIAMVGDGILVAEPPNLWFVESNDYVAGTRTLVDSTYAVGGNPEHQPNGLLYAIDNWIYSAKSDIRYRQRNGAWEKDSTEYRGQWGISQDDWGRLFYNHNSATLLGDNVPPNTFPSNPNHESTHGNIGRSKASNRVFTRRINPGVNRAYRKATLGDDGRLTTVTGACGPVVFRGDQFPDSHYGNAFVMEPTGNVIMRVVLSDDDGRVSGSAPYEGREFLSATDERFRPVNAYTGPDGALYVVDMYRGVIQHVTYLTDYLKRQIEQRGLDTPIDLGRIYRVRNTANELGAVPRLSQASVSELVGHLAHPNGWWRDTAQRLLVERGGAETATALRAVLRSVEGEHSDRTRAHVLWTLEGIGDLRINDLRRAYAADPTPKLGATVLRLASKMHTSDRDVDRAALLDFAVSVQSRAREVALQRIATLHTFRSHDAPRADEEILKMAAAHRGNTEFVDAIVGGLYGVEDAFQQRADSYQEVVPELYAAVEQARYSAQTGPMLAALALSGDAADQANRGRALFNTHCAACHGRDGRGLPALAPTLRKSSWLLQDAETPTRIALDGLTGAIRVHGKLVSAEEAQDVMPGLRSNQDLDDESLAAVLTYARNAWTNRAPVVTAATVSAVRRATRDRAGALYTADDLVAARDTGWTSLVPDEDFTGWQRLGGSALYHIDDGAVVGTTVANSPNTFLATEQHYGDFVLEFEVLVDSLINSGVQIRSHSLPEYQNGRVHGYQVEIDPSDRAWSAGIYDEARRGWLFDLRGNPAARAAFDRDGWNHYRVEARGAHLRTWLNGVLAADLIDDMTPSGFIALQVHSVGSPDLVGREIRWRNIRIKELDAGE